MTTSKPTYLNFRNYAYNMSTQRLSEQNAELLSDKTSRGAMRLPCTYNIRSTLANDLNRIVEKTQ